MNVFTSYPHSPYKSKKISGFTIVELLIVIVVIAILAAISIVAYNGIQDRARKVQISSDLGQLQKAIMAARVNKGDVALRYITGTPSTSGFCVVAESSVDLSNQQLASSCWSRYNSSLNAISDASGIDVRSLKDPWGRPYFIDETEGEFGCSRDVLGTFPLNRAKDDWTRENTTFVPLGTAACV